MAKHHHLIAWQRARTTVILVARLRRARWSPMVDAVFRQLLRASLSVQLNIAEGWAIGLAGARRRHWRIAYGSAVETEDLLGILRELCPECGEALGPIEAANNDSCAILASWLRRHRLEEETRRGGREEGSR